jgi:hypothetical protein
MFLVTGPLQSRQYADKQRDRHPYLAWIDRYRLDQNQHSAQRHEHDLQMLGSMIKTRRLPPAAGPTYRTLR